MTAALDQLGYQQLGSAPDLQVGVVQMVQVAENIWLRPLEAAGHLLGILGSETGNRG